ncbi:MAG: TetR/AcrR family transcriptional regulator [Myxococcales bacterium]|nr:TetR/AcrR family transcriptional regulator [Myxococcales bacterium]MCB9531346.1 TetR/AcrR family transcriptional regulator [Myxococcales bacterium]
MSRPSNTDERRAQIASGLITVMAKHGYDGASVSAIAKAAALTPGLVHYHFKNKQEILRAALAALVARHERRLDEQIGASVQTPQQKVVAFVDAHLGLGASADPEALACWILISGEALRQPAIQAEFTAAVAALTGRLESIIAAGCDSWVFRHPDPPAAAAAIVAAIQGYFVLAAVSPTVIPRGTALQSTLQMAEGLLGARLEVPTTGARR